MIIEAARARPMGFSFVCGIAAAVHTLAWGLWIGGVIAVGAIVAPSAFEIVKNLPQLAGNAGLQKAIAGAIVGTSFKWFGILSCVCGFAMLIADTFESLTGHGAKFTAATFVRSVVTIGLLALALYMAVHIMPEMDRQTVTNTTLFDSLHRQYVALTWVQIPLLLLVPLITSWRNESLRLP